MGRKNLNFRWDIFNIADIFLFGKSSYLLVLMFYSFAGGRDSKKDQRVKIKLSSVNLSGVHSIQRRNKATVQSIIGLQ